MSGFGTKKLKASADEFIHLFVNQPEWLSKFLEFIVSNGSASPLVYNTLLELYLRNETVCFMLYFYSLKKGFTVPGSQSPMIGKEEVKSNSSPISTSEMTEKKKQRLDKALKLLTNPEVLYFVFFY